MRFLLPFFDDSTLIFASFVGSRLSARRHDVTYCETPGATGGLSDRQRALHLAGRPSVFYDDVILAATRTAADAVIVCRIPPSLDAALRLLRDRIDVSHRVRPCFVAFQPGLEFTPSRGIRNRANFDVVFLNTPAHRDLFLRRVGTACGRHVGFGHPYFRLPERPLPGVTDGLGKGDVVFFPQAISPSTQRSRMHMLRVLDAIARANPDRRVVIKLRHLPEENAAHVHRETHPYPALSDGLPDGLAPNVVWASGTMERALADAACAITCTSTAAMDAISAGVPTAVHTSYVECYRDPLAPAAAQEFAGSGIDLTLEDLLHLRLRRPDPTWIAERFRGDDLYEELEAAVAAFAVGRSRSRGNDDAAQVGAMQS